MTTTDSVEFGKMHANQIIVRFIKQYLCIKVKLMLVYRVVDILGKGINFVFIIAPTGDFFPRQSHGTIRNIVCMNPNTLKNMATLIGRKS